MVEVWKEVMVEAGRASVRKRWERARLLAAGGEAGGRRGCQTHENERFSCSFFLQGEETSNRRLSKRAGHLDMVRPQAEIAWALLPRVVLPRSAGPSGCRKFPQFRRICRYIEVAVVAGRGAQRAGVRVAAVSEFAVVGVDLRLPQHYRNRLEKFDWLRGVAAADAGSLARGQFDA